MAERYLLTGGEVVAGDGRGPQRADVLLDATGILDVGAVAVEDATTIDVSGQIVAPGFVDAHVHAEGPLLEEGVVWEALSQGVTTMILGQDGCGWAPGHGEAFAYMRHYFRTANGDSPRLPDDGLSVGELLALYDRQTTCNVGYLVANGILRAGAVGLTDAEATPEQVAEMRRQLEVSLEEGALGLSSGFDYIPSRHARHEELVQIVAPMVGGGVYVSHMAGYGENVRRGISGLAQVGIDAGVAVHASHLWGPAGEIAAALDQAQAGGASISWDMYPFTAGCSLLSMVSIPPDWQHGSIEETVARLADPSGRSALRWHQVSTPPDLTMLMTIASPQHEQYVGLSAAAAAERAGQPLMDFVAELLVASRMQVGVLFYRPDLSDDDVAYVIDRPGYTAGSDGAYFGGVRHPRSTSTFTKILLDSLARHGRDRGWADAVHKLSTSAADRFGLGGRGRVRPGAPADVLVFDPDEIAVLASYENPAGLSRGLVHAFVGGAPVVSGGALTAARPGRALHL
jgi:N-acyl-D-amino-acid deacylase